MREIIIAENAGMCFGVRKAVEEAFRSASKHDKDIFIKGELVHNQHIVDKLERAGVKKIEDISEVPKDKRLIIRAHGDVKDVYDYCKNNNIEITDCTCIFVKKIQDLAKKLEKEGYHIVIIGKKEHPEIKSIASRLNNFTIIRDKDEISKISRLKTHEKTGVIVQTTYKKEDFEIIAKELERCCNELKICNTICSATSQRQKSAKKTAKKVDVMLVIGGKNSSNTRSLYEICKRIVDSYLIENKADIRKEWLSGKSRIGITAGASTPQIIIDEVVEYINRIQ